MSTSHDYYKDLGVPEDADGVAIKKAHWAAAKRWHTDLQPDNPEARRQFERAQVAYEVLSDPKRRAAYDKWGAAYDKRGAAHEAERQRVRNSYSTPPGAPPRPRAPNPPSIWLSPSQVDLGALSLGENGPTRTTIVVNDGGTAPGVQPTVRTDRRSGSFWTLVERRDGGTTGEIARLILRGRIPRDLSPGRHQDEVSIRFGSSSAILTLAVVVTTPPPSTPPSSGPPPSSHAPGAGPDAANPRESSGAYRMGRAVGSHPIGDFIRDYPQLVVPAAFLLLVALVLVLYQLYQGLFYASADPSPSYSPPAATYQAASPTVATSSPSTSRPVSEPTITPSTSTTAFQRPQRPAGMPAPVATSRFRNSIIAGSIDNPEDYLVEIYNIFRGPTTVAVAFGAYGPRDLVLPEKTCVIASVGSVTVEPTATNIAVSEPGRYVGTLTFPLIEKGQYDFVYGCHYGFERVVLLEIPL